MITARKNEHHKKIENERIFVTTCTYAVEIDMYSRPQEIWTSGN